MPVTTPVVDMVPTDVLLLLHTPPPGLQDNVVVAPTQTDKTPVILPGLGLTTIVADTEQLPMV